MEFPFYPRLMSYLNFLLVLLFGPSLYPVPTYRMSLRGQSILLINIALNFFTF